MFFHSHILSLLPLSLLLPVTNILRPPFASLRVLGYDVTVGIFMCAYLYAFYACVPVYDMPVYLCLCTCV